LLLQGIRIFGFEPNPKEYEKFKKNVDLNKYLEVHTLQLALSDQKGTCKMNALSDGLGVFGYLIEDGEEISNSHSDIVDVPTIDLDTWCKINNVEQINLIKVDVEGFELKVLQGASNLLSRQAIDIMIMEVGHGQWQDALNLLRSYDYKIDLICRDGSLVPFEQSNLKGWDNIIARPNSHSTS
jgi:FkbM family methyltransferase